VAGVAAAKEINVNLQNFDLDNTRELDVTNWLTVHWLQNEKQSYNWQSNIFYQLENYCNTKSCGCIHIQNLEDK
jgi:hypothetical protein